VCVCVCVVGGWGKVLCFPFVLKRTPQTQHGINFTPFTNPQPPSPTSPPKPQHGINFMPITNPNHKVHTEHMSPSIYIISDTRSLCPRLSRSVVA
jgi:hypothetical protein